MTTLASTAKHTPRSTSLYKRQTALHTSAVLRSRQLSLLGRSCSFRLLRFYFIGVIWVSANPGGGSAVHGGPACRRRAPGHMVVVADEPICRRPFSLAFSLPGPTDVVSSSGRAVVGREADAKRWRRNPDDPPWADCRWCPVVHCDIPADGPGLFTGTETVRLR